MHKALEFLFEEQLQFHLKDDTLVDGSVFIGETEFLPVETLRWDEDAYKSEFSRWADEVWIPEQSDRRAQILALHGNQKRYTDLRAAMERRQVIPLVGSGMSVPSGLPTWSDMLRMVRKYTKIEPPELEKLLSASAFEEAADLIAAASNPRLLNERVEHDLRIDDRRVISGPVRLLPALFSKVVITTNLDDVLEQHFQQCDAPFVHTLFGRDISRYRSVRGDRAATLLKLHGDCHRPESRILLTPEYEAAYAVGSTTREELTLLYRDNHILFLGASLGPDRTVSLLADVAANDSNMPKHYAFVKLPDSEADWLEKEHFLTERGIFPIWYDGTHDQDLTALLAGLLDV